MTVRFTVWIMISNNGSLEGNIESYLVCYIMVLYSR